VPHLSDDPADDFIDIDTFRSRVKIQNEPVPHDGDRH
jgi:hypothetical protein